MNRRDFNICFLQFESFALMLYNRLYLNAFSVELAPLLQIPTLVFVYVTCRVFQKIQKQILMVRLVYFFYFSLLTNSAYPFLSFKINFIHDISAVRVLTEVCNILYLISIFASSDCLVIFLVLH